MGMYNLEHQTPVTTLVDTKHSGIHFLCLRIYNEGDYTICDYTKPTNCFSRKNQVRRLASSTIKFPNRITGTERRLAAIPIPGLNLSPRVAPIEPQVEIEPAFQEPNSLPLVTLGAISAGICFVGCVLRKVFQRTRK